MDVERTTQAVTAALSPFIEADAVPGVVAIVADRTGATSTVALGADPATGRPMAADTIFRLASMTKLITAVGVMRLVDEGRLRLDDPIAEYLPEFDDLQVLEGYDDAGQARLRPQRERPTVRQVLANVSGLGYEIWNGDLNRYYEETGTPSAATGAWRSLTAPLVCDPGAEIHYGTGADWAGVLVERVSGRSYDEFLAEQIIPVLRTDDMTPVLTAAQRDRLPDVMTRSGDGGYVSTPIDYPLTPDFRAGGGSVYATVGDFMKLQLALLNGGEVDGRRLLSSASVSEMMSPQTGALDIPAMPSWIPFLSETVEFEPRTAWGLGMCVNREPGRDGRGVASGGWAGLFNTYFWIDPVAGIAAGIYFQLVPFFDAEVVAAIRAFERAVYDSVNA